jgi:hypothetical protein
LSQKRVKSFFRLDRCRLITLSVATVCLFIGCRGAATIQPVSQPSKPSEPQTAQAPRFPTPDELARAQAVKVLGGHTVRLPAENLTCWNGSVVKTVVECVTREVAVRSLSLKAHQPAPMPIPENACPALCISWRGGRSPMEASPHPGLFDPDATLDARRKEPGACCYRAEGHCPDSPAENTR